MEEPDDIFRRTRHLCKQRGDDFAHEAAGIIAELHSTPSSEQWLAEVAECIPRLFASDVVTGYDLFHREEVLLQVWQLYNRATALYTSLRPMEPAVYRDTPPYRIACITGIFWDVLAPSKVIAEFALNLDRELFDPVVITTNQFFTLSRKVGTETPGQENTHLGLKLKEAGIPVISLGGASSVLALTDDLIKVCREQRVDLTVSNGSLFSFPDACLAVSGATRSFFDLHQGFPLYCNGIDAILHYIPETRKQQLGLWEQEGGRVIEYRFGVPVRELPEVPGNQGIVYCITASNHLEERLTPEFCALVGEVMLRIPYLHYTLIGSGDPERLRSGFPESVRNRVDCVGAVTAEHELFAYLCMSDIYLNEFPVGGGRVVLEAMCAALPVIVMCTGSRHVENMGASLIGDAAISENDPALYREMLLELAQDAASRVALGKRMRQRAEEVYDIHKTTAELAAKILEIHEGKPRD